MRKFSQERFLGFLAVVILTFTASVTLGQELLEDVIGKRIKATEEYNKMLRATYTTDWKITSFDLNYMSTPIITYDLSKASYIPSEFNDHVKGFPNCTKTSKEINETYKYTVSLRRSGTIERSDVFSEKLVLSLKIPVGGLMDLSMSNETVNTLSLKTQNTTEKSETLEESKSLKFNIDPNTFQYVRVRINKGVLRVPFHAEFTIKGQISFYFYKTLGTTLSGPGPYNIVRDIDLFLSPEQKVFVVDGFVTSESSSEENFLYDERPIDRKKDCIFQNTVTGIELDPKTLKPKNH